MPKKILLADDSITIQKVVELTFSDGDYEVTAVNNGAKAVQKLADMRPDIILSDIIMPEKNGYEVCEFVKSHPDFRNIPVVLLTGTFEPFDPDRAEKAGCDAVVTKPFESQSLIHKVEELIAQAQSNASAPAAIAEPEQPAASPWMDDPAAVTDVHVSPFSTASGNYPAAGGPPDAFTHTPDIFSAAPASEPSTDMPFEMPNDSPFGASAEPEQFSGETRAFPRMSFEDMQQMAASAPAAAPAPEPAATSPWDDAPVDAGETRAFQKMSFDDFAASTPAPVVNAAPDPESPFGGDANADDISGATRAFPRMSFDDIQQLASNDASSQQAAAPAPAEPEPSPWSEPASASPWSDTPSAASPFDTDTPAFGGETRAFPKLDFNDLQQMAASTPPPATEQEPAPWGDPIDDTPAFGGETRAFPKLDFNDFAPPAADVPAAPEPLFESEPEPEPQPEPEQPAAQAMPWNEPEPSGTAFEAESGSPFAPDPEPAAAEALWSPTADTSSIDTPAAESFSTAAAAPFTDAASPFAAPDLDADVDTDTPAVPEDLPFARETTPEPEPLVASEPSWSPIPAAEAQAEPSEPVVPPAALAPEAPPMPIAARSGELSDDQVDRIARRVIELMSDQVVRNIAWEVIPDMAEMVVKERIRQLEAE
ncbi:MAG: response regulator [Acidobacteriota bacterium]|nr:response regulator [Acidobacteriota bacterium]